MAIVGRNIVWDLVANDHATEAFHKVSHAVDSTEGSHQKLKTGVMVAGAAAGLAIGEFADKSIEKYQEVGKEVLKLQRYTGQSAEQASRLRFAAEESGVGADQLSKGLGFLSKSVAHAADDYASFAQKQAEAAAKGKPFTGQLGATGAAFGALGVSATDASGHLRPMHDVLMDASDQLSKMPAGAEKTALTLKLFGKAGMDLLPMLNRGRDGLSELEAESDKLGNTMDSKDTAAVHRNIMAKREMDATITGLEMTLGQHLIPVMAAATEKLAQFTQWAEHNATTVKIVVGVIGGLAAAVFLVNTATKVATATQAAWNTVTSLFVTKSAAATGATEAQTVAQAELDAAMDANPIGLVVLAVAALAAGFIYAYKHSETFRQVVDTAMHGVQVVIGNVVGAIIDYFHFMIDVWSTVIGGIIHAAAKVASTLHLPFASGLNKVDQEFQDTKTKVDQTLSSMSASAKGWGANVADGFAGGISANSYKAVAAAGDMANKVSAQANKMLGNQSPSKVFAQIGRWVGEGFIKGLVGTSDEVGTALDDFLSKVDQATSKMKTKVDDTIGSIVTSGKTKLTALSDKAASLYDSFKTVAGSVTAAGSLGGLGGRTDADGNQLAPTSGTIVEDLTGQVAAAGQFTQQLQQLRSMGLNVGSLADLSTYSASNAAAVAALVAGGHTAIVEVNKLEAALAVSANSAGKTGSQAMYQAGVDTAQGLARGFASQQDAIDAQMLHVARSMQRAIRRALGIHSPSTVFHEIGTFTGQGLVNGLDSMRGDVDAAARSLVNVPAAVGAAAAGAPAGALPGGGAGQDIVNSLPPLLVQLRAADGQLMQQELLRFKRTNGGIQLGLG